MCLHIYFREVFFLSNQCQILKENQRIQREEIKAVHHGLKGFVSWCTICTVTTLEEVTLSAESTAVLLPETLLAGGKDEEKAENEHVPLKKGRLVPASPKKY